MHMISGDRMVNSLIHRHAMVALSTHGQPRNVHPAFVSIKAPQHHKQPRCPIVAAFPSNVRGPSRNNSDRNAGNNRRGGKDMIPMNEYINAPEVRLLDEAKEPLGVVATSEALAMARSAGVDLIMVVPDASPPVCRLVDFSKYNYELTKAAKDAKKKQRENMIETKELKLRPATDVHDYQVKLRAAQKFLSKGARVKLTLQFKGREMEFKEIGREMFARFVEDLGGADAISIEQAAQMQGRQMNMVIGPKKEVI